MGASEISHEAGPQRSGVVLFGLPLKQAEKGTLKKDMLKSEESWEKFWDTSAFMLIPGSFECGVDANRLQLKWLRGSACERSSPSGPRPGFCWGRATRDSKVEQYDSYGGGNGGGVLQVPCTHEGCLWYCSPGDVNTSNSSLARRRRRRCVRRWAVSQFQF